MIEIETFGVSDEELERLRAIAGVASIATETREQALVLHVQSASGPELVQQLLRELDETTVGRVIAREPTLEDAYVELVKQP